MSVSNDSPEKVAKSKKLRFYTAILLLVTLGIAIGWDVFVATNDVKEDTISELTRDLSHDFWIVPFMVMGVMGHLFLNIKTTTERKRNVPAMIGACAVVGARDVLNYFVVLPTFFYANFVVGAVGFALGAWWWPQTYPGQQKTEEKSAPEADLNSGEA